MLFQDTHCVPKTFHFVIVYVFVKCRPIFKILLLAYFVKYLQQIIY